MIIVGASAGVRWSFGILVVPLSEQFGWDTGAVSFAYFIVFISAIPLTLAAGWFTDRYGIRLMLPMGVVVFTLGMLLTASMKDIFQFYLFYGVLVGAVHMVFSALLTATVTRWFHRRAGLAVGLVFASTGIGPVLMAPVFSLLMGSAGWASTFLLIGIPAGTLMLMAAVLLRSLPGDVGRTAYGEAPATSVGNVEARPARRLTLRMIQGDRTFWFLIAVHFLGCLGHSVLIVHVVPIAIHRGASSLTAAGLISTISGTSIASRFGIPILTERWGGRTTLSLALLVQSVAIVMYLGAESSYLLYAVSVIFGLGLGGEMSGFPIINGRYYGQTAPLNSIHAWEWSGGLMGMALGGWLGGVLFDLSGAYTWSILLAAAASFATLPFIFSLPGRSARQPLINLPSTDLEPVDP
jgi:MFS family permease